MLSENINMIAENFNQITENFQVFLFELLKYVIFGIDIQGWYLSLTEGEKEVSKFVATKTYTSLCDCDTYYLNPNPFLRCAEQCVRALDMTCAVPTYVIGFTPIPLLMKADSTVQETATANKNTFSQAAESKIIHEPPFTGEIKVLPQLIFIFFSLSIIWLALSWKKTLKYAIKNSMASTATKPPVLTQPQVAPIPILTEETSLIFPSSSVCYNSGSIYLVCDWWSSFFQKQSHNALVAKLAEAQNCLARQRAQRKQKPKYDENLRSLSSFLVAINRELSLMELQWEQSRIELQNKQAVRYHNKALNWVLDFSKMVENEHVKRGNQLQKIKQKEKQLLEFEAIRRFGVSSSNGQLMREIEKLQKPSESLRQDLDSLSQWFKNDPYERVKLPSSEAKPLQYIQEVQEMLEFRSASIELFRNHMKELQQQPKALTSLQKSSTSCNINYIINYAKKMDSHAQDWQDQRQAMLNRAATLKDSQDECDYSTEEQTTFATCLATSYDCFLNDQKFKSFFALLPQLCTTLGSSYYEALRLPCNTQGSK